VTTIHIANAYNVPIQPTKPLTKSKKKRPQQKPVQGLSRASRLNIRHKRKQMKLTDDKISTIKQNDYKSFSSIKSNIGLLQRMSLLPIESKPSNDMEIVAKCSKTTILYTHWKNQLRQIDWKKLDQLKYQVNEFIEKRLMNIQNEAIAITSNASQISNKSAKNNFDMIHPSKNLQPPPPLLQLTTHVKPSIYPLCSRNTARSADSNISINSTSKVLNQVKFLTESFTPDVVSLSVEKLDALLELRHTENELHPSLIQLNSNVVRDKYEDWKKFGSHINKNQWLRGKPNKLGLQVSTDEHVAHRSLYMPFYHKNKRDRLKKKSPRLPKKFAMEKYTSRIHSTFKKKKNDTFYLLSDVKCDIDMSEISKERIQEKNQEILTMLNELDPLMDPQDLIQNNRSLLLKF
jgi:hypothetical protein